MHKPVKESGFVNGKGQGAIIKTRWPIIEKAFNRLVKDYFIINKKAALPENGKPLVFIAAHGSLIAPMPAMAIISKIYMDAGLGDLVMGFYPHPVFIRVPGFRHIFEKAGAPTLAYDTDTLVELIENKTIDVVGTAPEGVSCNFTWDEYVGPLRSGGMMEVAIRTNATICLMAHQGGDKWNIRLKLPFGLKAPLTGGLTGINIPLAPIRKIDRVGLAFKRYRPGIKAPTLLKMTKREKHLALVAEMARVKSELILMTDKVKEKMEDYP